MEIEIIYQIISTIILKRNAPQLYLMKYGYMEVPSPETRSAQLLAHNGLLDYILEFQVKPSHRIIIGQRYEG